MNAWMFPGQGSQFPGMGRHLMQEFPITRQIMAEAEELSGVHLDAIRLRGPMDAMTRVAVLEPLITATSIGYAQTLLDAGLSPDFVAGYSAGEVTAMYVAGVLTRHDALQVAAIRGRVLSGHTDASVRMVAVSRVERSVVEKIIYSQNEVNGWVEVAGWNAPDHVTLVGPDRAVRSAESELVAAGGETTNVAVSGMWHSSRLMTAAEELHAALLQVPFAAPQIPILTSATGAIETAPAELRRHLADQVALPVQWQSVIGHLRANGVTQFTEVGTGRTLMGLLRRNWPEASQYSVTSVEGRAGNIKPLKRILSSLTQ